jgi:hypothetical protein
LELCGRESVKQGDTSMLRRTPRLVDQIRRFHHETGAVGSRVAGKIGK